MDSTIAAKIIRALDTEVESVGWRSLLLGQKIITHIFGAIYIYILVGKRYPGKHFLEHN
jgi:hypothetical protein